MSEYQGRLCPLCGGHIYRVPRHWADRLLSVVYPVHRYACRSSACDWEGLLRRRRESETVQGSGKWIIEPSQMSSVHRSH